MIFTAGFTIGEIVLGKMLVSTGFTGEHSGQIIFLETTLLTTSTILFGCAI